MTDHRVSALDLAELRAIVAREWGSEEVDANGLPTAPTDAYEVALIDRVIERAIRRILSEHEWSWLRQTLSLDISATATEAANINGDAARYRLPSWFVDEGESTWSYDSNGPLYSLKSVTPAYMRELRSGTVRNGNPTHLAVQRLDHESAASATPGYEAVVWPTPSESRTITTKAEAWPYSVLHSDTFVAGRHYDHLLDAAVRLEAVDEMRLFADQVPIRAARYAEALQKAIMRDNSNRGRIAGKLKKTSRDPRRGDTVHNIPYSSMTVNGTTLE